MRDAISTVSDFCLQEERLKIKFLLQDKNLVTKVRYSGIPIKFLLF